MKRRRAGATETFSVSVDSKTKAILKARAERLHGGNMSELITQLGLEAARRDAFDWIQEWQGGSVLTDAVRDRIDAELAEGWEHARRHARAASPKHAKAPTARARKRRAA